MGEMRTKIFQMQMISSHKFRPRSINKMKYTSAIFAFSLYFCHSASALLDCDIQVSRATDEGSACAHFEGIDADPYRSWYDDFEVETRYTSMVYLKGSDPSKPEDGAAIHWKVDENYVHVAIAVHAMGWVGFGIAEAGGMIGADMALFEAAKPNEIIDAYTTDVRVPVVDDCPSDWELVSSEIDEQGGFIMIELKRLLQTNDPQDKAIFNDASTLVPAHRVIAAWGDSPEVGYHGLNRARGAIRFYGLGDDKATFDREMEEKAEGTFLVASINHEIASNETEYAYTCVTRDDLIAQGVLNTTDLINIIGFEPVIEKGHEAYVHHYIISGSSTGECTFDGMIELVYVWAPGEGPVSLPDNLGTPLFGEDGFSAFQIEVHYNNPQLVEGIIDNSGVRIFWTSQPRDEQVGILSVGDPVVSLFGEPVGDGPSVHTFECPGTCSELAGRPVTVLREYLHMHETGARILNEHIRDGEVIRQASLDYWEFHQNGNAAIQQDPFVIQPGDGFKTSCFFNGEGRVFGLASSEEMCMAFLYYYPRTKLRVEEMDLDMPWICGYNLGFPTCDTIHESKTLSSVDDFGRTFGTSSQEICEMTEAPVGAPTNETPDSAASSLRMTVVTMMLFALGRLNV